MRTAAFLGLAALAGWLLVNGSRSAVAPGGTERSESGAANTAAVAVASTPDARFQKLAGRWLRPDGGYILEIGGVDGTGKMEAAYRNPRPIHVARAEASLEKGEMNIFVELRDVNYPGSTYRLVYDRASDQLKGIYFQAALNQRYDVFFERQK